MSKTEDMAALRQQIRDDLRATAEPGGGPARPAKPSTDVQRTASAPGGLCGHRGMGNRPCICPADHPEANHRYAKAAPPPPR